jgi:hypothetical protein
LPSLIFEFFGSVSSTIGLFLRRDQYTRAFGSM